MLESLNFTYDGISCEDMGVTLVLDGNGEFQEQLFAKRKVNYERIPYRDKSILKRVDYEPLSFTLPLYLNEWKDRNNLRAIGRWLFQDSFKPLIFESNTDQIFYAIVDGDTSLLHNGNQEGLVKIPVICDSQYAYSDLKVDYITINGTETRSYFNEGDATIRPQLRITKIGDGDISIKNEANSQELILTGIYDGEIISINGENEEIISSLESSNRYIIDQHNDVWLDFDSNMFSDTVFTFTGNFECEFYYEYKYINQDRPIYFD